MTCLWRHDKLFDVMACFWRHDKLFDVMTNSLRSYLWWYNKHFWRHEVFLMSRHIFDIMTNFLTSLRVVNMTIVLHQEFRDVFLYFMTNFCMSWRVFYFMTNNFFDVITNCCRHDLSLTSWRTFWRHDVFLTSWHILWHSWHVCDFMNFLTSWHVFDELFDFMTYFWCHDVFLTS